MLRLVYIFALCGFFYSSLSAARAADVNPSVVAKGARAPKSSGPDKGPYSFIEEFSVAGDGGWDYLSIDAVARRLYVTHGDVVSVVDLESRQVVGEISGTPGVHGFAIAHELGRGFSSNGKENKISIVDLKSLATIQKVEAGSGPDAIIYNPAEQEVYAFNGKSQNATVLNARTGQVVATVPLAGRPEFAAVDPGLHRVFVAIEDKNLITVIDSRSHKIITTWPIAPGEEPAGMDIDVARHLLYVGCHNKLMLMIDGRTGHLLAQTPIGGGVDSTWYDAATNLAFSSNGEGTVTIASVAVSGVANAGVALSKVSVAGVSSAAAARPSLKSAGTAPDGAITTAGTAPDASSVANKPASAKSGGLELSATASAVKVRNVDADAVTGGKFTPVQTLTTRPRARTMALDPVTHVIYLASAEFLPPSEAKPGAPKERPQQKPGTFKILVYGPQNAIKN